MTVRRLLGAALMVSVMLGGLVLVTAEPAAACSCVNLGSDAAKAAHADAVFVGTLISQVNQIDPASSRRNASSLAPRIRGCWSARSGMTRVGPCGPSR